MKNRKGQFVELFILILLIIFLSAGINYFIENTKKSEPQFIKIPKQYPLWYNESSIGKPIYDMNVTVELYENCPRQVYDIRGNKLDYYCGLKGYDDKVYIKLLEYYPDKDENIIILEK